MPGHGSPNSGSHDGCSSRHALPQGGKAHPDRGITFGGTTSLELHGLTDSNHATLLSRGKATGGFAFFISGGAVSYMSGLHPVISLSTAEAEYIQLCIAIREAIFIRQMLSELGFPPDGPTRIGEDNTACISIATNEITSHRTKHIDIRYHFVRAAVRDGLIGLHYVPTKEMAADIFTKPLRNPQFTRLAQMVMRFSEEGC